MNCPCQQSPFVEQYLNIFNKNSRKHFYHIFLKGNKNINRKMQRKEKDTYSTVELYYNKRPGINQKISLITFSINLN